MKHRVAFVVADKSVFVRHHAARQRGILHAEYLGIEADGFPDVLRHDIDVIKPANHGRLLGAMPVPLKVHVRHHFPQLGAARGKKRWKSSENESKTADPQFCCAHFSNSRCGRRASRPLMRGMRRETISRWSVLRW